jgi:hypothetical protein
MAVPNPSAIQRRYKSACSFLLTREQWKPTGLVSVIQCELSIQCRSRIIFRSPECMRYWCQEGERITCELHDQVLALLV